MGTQVSMNEEVPDLLLSRNESLAVLYQVLKLKFPNMK